MKKNTFHKKIKGFTLIEVMVSIAVFAIIMTVGVGALVTITHKYNVSKDQKLVADNLSFMLESITREIRLGTRYYSGSGSNAVFFEANPRDGKSGSVGFEMANPSDIRGRYMSYSLEGNVLRRYRYDMDGDPISVDELNDPSSVVIEELDFTVVGADESGTNDGRQPLVWVRMKARPVSADLPISLQTLVSQRALDF